MRDVAIVAGAPRTPFDGIADHSRNLAAGLRDLGVPATVEWFHPGLDRLDAEHVIVQYNPFSFGRRGFAPALLVALRRIRRHSDVAVIVHERYVPPGGYRQTAMSLWQHAQLAGVCSLAQRVLVTVGKYRNSPWSPYMQRAGVLPVGSNLPDMRSSRDEMRRQLRIDDDSLVLATFGQRHPGRRMVLVEEAVRAAQQSAGGNVVLLNLGGDPPSLALDSGVRLIAPGPLGDRETAATLSAADLYLAPFADGVSTRRTTVMAALQHALPVVGTRGAMTDGALLSDRVLALSDVDRPGAFGAAAAQLARDRDARNDLGRRGRALYEREYAWPVLAGRLLSEVERCG
jgi:glycosyltransferase involved in cell wall biosynthesis